LSDERPEDCLRHKKREEREDREKGARKRDRERGKIEKE
jgi:hypothetical protein